MLTLFPRIRPNPIPPPLPLEPPAPEIAEPAQIAMEAPAQNASANRTETEPVSTREASTSEGTASGDATTSISHSDVFSAFLSGMASGNPEPFIVEISGEPAEPKKVSDVSHSVSQGFPERALEIGTGAAPSEEEAVTSDVTSPDNAIASAHEEEPVSEAIHAQEDTGSTSPGMVIAGANIFDELDVLHEAATASSLHVEAQTSFDSVPKLAPAVELQNHKAAEVAEATDRLKSEDEPQAAALVPMMESQTMAPSETAAAISEQDLAAEDLLQRPASSAAPVRSGTEEATSGLNSSKPASQQTASQEPPVNMTHAETNETAVEDSPAGNYVSQEEAVTSVASTSGNSEGVQDNNSNRPPARPPKPRRAKGTLFGLARVPEPETMDDSGEVEAYASAAAQAHLDAIDDTFVAHAQLLLKGRERGRVLDIGTGPGQIVIKLGYRLTRWKFVGIDRSATMIEKAVESLATAGELAGRVEFRVADGNALAFPSNSFEMVVCNSVLHHILDPRKLFSEIARVVKPGGAILLRDLRRPSRPGYAFHVWKHGKHYSGEMRRLFIASVQAAYTEEELQKLIAASPLRDVRVFRHGKTHIGFERPLADVTPARK